MYVGDAAGRPKGTGAAALARPKKDHSASDMLFAAAVGLKFVTPEALFLSSHAPADRQPWVEATKSQSASSSSNAASGNDGLGKWWPCKEIPAARVTLLTSSSSSSSAAAAGGGDPEASAAFVPSLMSAATTDGVATASAGGGAGGSGQELVLLVGPPGCGKSTYAAHTFALAGEPPSCIASDSDGSSSSAYGAAAGVITKGRTTYVRVNQDKLGGHKERALAAADAALAAGYSVVVDATNADAAKRSEWVKLVDKANANTPSSSSASTSGDGSNRGAPISVRAVFFSVPRPLALHLNDLRAFSPLGGIDGPDDKRKVPGMAIHAIANSLTLPDAAKERLPGGVTSLSFSPGPFVVNEAALAQAEALLSSTDQTTQPLHVRLARTLLLPRDRAPSLPNPLPASLLQVYAEALALQALYAFMS